MFDPATPARARLVSKASSSILGVMVDMGCVAAEPVRLVRGATAFPAGDGGAMVEYGILARCMTERGVGRLLLFLEAYVGTRMYVQQRYVYSYVLMHGTHTYYSL
jgi:hypothetical protein